MNYHYIYIFLAANLQLKHVETSQTWETHGFQCEFPVPSMAKPSMAQVLLAGATEGFRGRLGPETQFYHLLASLWGWYVLV